MESVRRPLFYARANRSRFLKELKEFVRFPSVSVEPQHAGDVKKCALWLAEHLSKIGPARAQLIPTGRHPIVYGQWRGALQGPTILIYGHYDVQPVDPVREWATYPFKPVVKGKHLYGRGVSDDKGQLFIHLKAVESYFHSSQGLPVNLKCLFEGEEEIGSPHLTGFIERNRRALAADVAVISDTSMHGLDRPALSYSLRGQLAVELEVVGPHHDLHSGSFGGAVHNPLQALCEMIAQLHDRGGRVSIPGFYDRVGVPSKRERNRLRHTGRSNERILHDAAVPSGWGDRTFTTYERVTVRPSLTINGISGGYTGVGAKAVIPSRASAKLSFRLVAGQDPREVEALFRTHIARITPPTVKSVVHYQGSAWPAVVDRRHPALFAASSAYRKAFGRGPILTRSGGSIPAVSIFQQVLGIPTVLMGFGLPDDRIHAPNEKFHLSNFYRGIETSIWFLNEIRAALQNRGRVECVGSPEQKGRRLRRGEETI
jgi:acetylornithine deacetylase/succinyl-diaminopimelate desuccinylase-like protein